MQFSFSAGCVLIDTRKVFLKFGDDRLTSASLNRNQTSNSRFRFEGVRIWTYRLTKHTWHVWESEAMKEFWQKPGKICGQCEKVTAAYKIYLILEPTYLSNLNSIILGECFIDRPMFKCHYSYKTDSRNSATLKFIVNITCALRRM